MRAHSLILAAAICVLTSSTAFAVDGYYQTVYNSSTETITGIYVGYFSEDSPTDDVGPNMIGGEMWTGYEVEIGPLYECIFDMFLTTDEGNNVTLYEVDLCEGEFEISGVVFTGD
jgi:hypothetical protein